MEFIEGESLQRKYKERGDKFLPADILPWMLQVLDILTYLHTQSPPIIFRDLKPSNIMITAGGKVKLVDFGIARHFVPGKLRDTQIMGTPGFSAPEQYGSRQTDCRSDLYAFGATMYFLLSGKDTEAFNFNFPPLTDYNSDVPPGLSTILAAVLDKNPDRRPASAAAIKAQLGQALEDPEAQAVQPPPPAAWSFSQNVFSRPWMAFSYCLVLMLGSLVPLVGLLSGFIGAIGMAILAVYSLGAIVYHGLRRDFKAALSSCALLLACSFFIVIPATFYFSATYNTREQSRLTACKSNLHNIGAALEIYGQDNGKKYPPALDRLLPGYLKALPTCPAARRDSYSGAYAVGRDAGLFTIFCTGSYHKAMLGHPDFPQYDSTNGLIEHPGDI
jgi:hypothetical protein